MQELSLLFAVSSRANKWDGGNGRVNLREASVGENSFGKVIMIVVGTSEIVLKVIKVLLILVLRNIDKV